MYASYIPWILLLEETNEITVCHIRILGLYLCLSEHAKNLVSFRIPFLIAFLLVSLECLKNLGFIQAEMNSAGLNSMIHAKY